MWLIKVKQGGSETVHHFEEKDAAMLALGELADRYVGSRDCRITLERLGKEEKVCIR